MGIAKIKCGGNDLAFSARTRLPRHTIYFRMGDGHSAGPAFNNPSGSPLSSVMTRGFSGVFTSTDSSVAMLYERSGRSGRRGGPPSQTVGGGFDFLKIWRTITAATTPPKKTIAKTQVKITPMTPSACRTDGQKIGEKTSSPASGTAASN
jgi:hypothetical protein